MKIGKFDIPHFKEIRWRHKTGGKRKRVKIKCLGCGDIMEGYLMVIPEIRKLRKTCWGKCYKETEWTISEV